MNQSVSQTKIPADTAKRMTPFDTARIHKMQPVQSTIEMFKVTLLRMGCAHSGVGGHLQKATMTQRRARILNAMLAQGQVTGASNSCEAASRDPTTKQLSS